MLELGGDVGDPDSGRDRASRSPKLDERLVDHIKDVDLFFFEQFPEFPGGRKIKPAPRQIFIDRHSRVFHFFSERAALIKTAKHRPEAAPVHPLDKAAQGHFRPSDPERCFEKKNGGHEISVPGTLPMSFFFSGLKRRKTVPSIPWAKSFTHFRKTQGVIRLETPETSRDEGHGPKYG